MKPADVFAVVVRTIGLLMCLAAAAILFWGVINLAFGGPANVFALGIVGIPSLGVGLWLLRGAPSLIAFAFPTSRPRDREHFFGQLVTGLRREGASPGQSGNR